MKPTMVEVIAYAPTQYFHCQHCEVVWKHADIDGVKKFHDDAAESSIPPDLMKQYRAVSDWVIDAVERYGGRVVFKVIDATSFEGLLKSVRYGVRRFPAIVVDGKDKYVGTDFQAAEGLIARHLQAPAT
jgi:hypothetical protein